MSEALIAKLCRRCSTMKPLSEFHRHPRGPMGRHSWCKPCGNAYERATRNRKTRPEQRRRWNLRTKYGISPDIVTAMWEAQQGLCAICLRTMPSPRVDHDHRTGAVRGLLCHRCNLKLSGLEDQGFMERALTYLGRV